MTGYRTYASLVVIVLGLFGLGNIITEGDAAKLIDLVLQVAGLVGAAYFRYKATK